MFTKIGMRCFRGIEELEIDGLQPINLIVGRNNAGKSTVLEAVDLLGGGTNPTNPIMATTLGQLRGQRLGASFPDAVWRPMFFEMDPRRPIELWAKWESDARDRRLKIEALNVSGYADELEANAGASGDVAAVTQRQFGISQGLKERPPVA